MHNAHSAVAVQYRRKVPDLPNSIPEQTSRRADLIRSETSNGESSAIGLEIPVVHEV
jgi:hypothetical protein